MRLKDGPSSPALCVMRRIDRDDIGCGCYTNVGIMDADGQTSVPEAAVLGGKLETGLAFPARPVTPKADIDLIRERLKVAEQFAKELKR